MTGDVKSIPMNKVNLCMWSESGLGPTGHSFVCADQAEPEHQTGYVTECDEDGKILEILLEVRVQS